MIGMLKSESFKFRNSHVLWIIIGVISVFCSISILMGTYSSAEITLTSVSEDIMVPLLSCAIYGTIILTDDYSNGLMKHFIAHGYRRSSIIFAKLIHYIGGCSILLFVYPSICIFLTTMLRGVQTSLLSVFQEMVKIFFRTLPLYWGIFAFFFFLSVFIQKGVIVMGISVAVSIFVVVFTNMFYINTESLLQYSPIIQIVEAANNRITNAYFISLILSLALLFICAIGSIIKLNNDEF